MARSWVKPKPTESTSGTPPTPNDHRPVRIVSLQSTIVLVEKMMRSGITDKLLSARSYEGIYDVPRSFGNVMGDFTSMQLATDIGYSPFLTFSENDFIVPGPGCLDGPNKSFNLSLGPPANNSVRFVPVVAASQQF